MKKIVAILLVVLIVSACSKPLTSNSTPTSSLPTPGVTTVAVPDVAVAVNQFLSLWNSADYSGMYAMLAQTSKDAITEEDFVKIYTDTASAVSLKQIESGIVSSLVKPASATVGYQVNLVSNLYGNLSRTMEMTLVNENNTWKIQWHAGLIMPELAGGNHLASNIQAPARGDINDRNGNTLATVTQAVALGIIPNQISWEYEPVLLDTLSGALNKPKNIIKDLYKNAGDRYVPLGEVSQAGYDSHATTFDSYGGLYKNPYTSRYYYNGGVGPHVLGYMSLIPAEEIDYYTRLGYARDAEIGAAGIEEWGEDYLSGQPAADLYVVKPDGTYDTRLANVDPKAPDTITLTLDKDFQLLVQKALYGFSGAIVVMEVDTGRILAMASSPDFDPNVMQQQNYNFQYAYNDIINSQNAPLYNRALQGQYPLGSVFKLITAAAALETDMYTPESTYDCTSQYTELSGFIGDDWTFTKGLPPSGTLTILEGLMRSCNPWFYHLGYDLYQEKGPTYLSDMARGFGLGSQTGIEGLGEEKPGSIIDPTTDGAAVQMGIGQGDMLVTPIQVVDFIAAIANGGTLYKPQVVEKISTINGAVIQSFTPQVRGTLPVSAETIAALQEGMRMVVEDQRGTAHGTFVGMETPIYGKTGTATTSLEDPNSWFAGYTDANNPDKPDIAIAVIAENAGDGSKIAAPIFRRVIQDYFLGGPANLYPWEYDYYLTVTPTLEGETTQQP